MTKDEIKAALTATERYVKKIHSGEGSGHDWWHIVRVHKMARHIAKHEKAADMFVVELASLLHDVADRKFNEGDINIGVKKVEGFLHSLTLPEDKVKEVCEIILTCSFASSFLKNGTRRKMKTLEGEIVQDADRLDALGAIGIARAFAYGGNKGREIYNPLIKPSLPNSKDEYTKNESHSINHFYEKLLTLKDFMNTPTAKKMALHRHTYMEEFLKEFYSEWEGVV